MSSLLAAVLALGFVAGCGGGTGGDTAGSAVAEGRSQPDHPERSRPGAREPSKSQGKSDSSTRGRTPVVARSIIRTGQLTVQTRTPRKAADRAESLVSGTDGYVSSREGSREPGTGFDRVEVVLRVPVDDFDDVRTDLGKLGKVLSDKQQTTDVTEDLVDVESRIKSQERSIERLRALLGTAKDVGDVVSIETELATREADLESLQSRQAALSAQTSLSTVTVRFVEPEPSDTRRDETGFVVGLKKGWDALVASTTVVLTALGASLPFLVVLAVIGAPLFGLIVRLRRRHRPTPIPAEAEAPLSS